MTVSSSSLSSTVLFLATVLYCDWLTWFLSERPLIHLHGNPVCWSLVYMEMCSIPSWFPRINFHGNVFVNAFPKNGSACHSIMVTWVMALGCILVGVYQCFKRTYCLHHPGSMFLQNSVIYEYLQTTVQCQNPGDQNMNLLRPYSCVLICYIVPYRPIARQRPQNKQRDNW
jgi:hypothetical protein